MATDQVTVTRESLHEEFRRDAMHAGLLLAASWLWAIFSFFTSTSAGTWFARSGAVMCLIGAAATRSIHQWSPGSASTAYRVWVQRCFILFGARVYVHTIFGLPGCFLAAQKRMLRVQEVLGSGGSRRLVS